MAAVTLIIPAAGMGERLGVGVPKALYPIGGRPLLVHAVRAGVASGRLTAVVVAAPPGRSADVLELLRPEVPPHITVRVVDGGDTRQVSVWAALAAVPEGVDTVLVHDAARCLAPAGLFADVVDAVEAGHDAVVPGLDVVDTLKQIDDDGAVVATPDRSALRAVQTPQGFRRKLLERAHEAAADSDGATDDAGLVERLGYPVHVIPGHPEAFKVTRGLDVVLAEAVLAERTT